jgi:hypothetical protein
MVGIKCADSSAHGLSFIRRLEAIASLVTTMFMASRVSDAIEDYHCTMAHRHPGGCGLSNAGAWVVGTRRRRNRCTCHLTGIRKQSCFSRWTTRESLKAVYAALIWTSAFAKVRGIACTGHGSKVPPPVKQWVNAKHNGRRRPCSALSKPDVSCCRWQRRR